MDDILPLNIAVFFVVDITSQSWNHLHTWVLEASEAINGLNNEKTSLSLGWLLIT